MSNKIILSQAKEDEDLTGKIIYRYVESCSMQRIEQIMRNEIEIENPILTEEQSFVK